MREEYHAAESGWHYSRCQTPANLPDEAYWPWSSAAPHVAGAGSKGSRLMGNYGHSNCQRVVPLVPCLMPTCPCTWHARSCSWRPRLRDLDAGGWRRSYLQASAACHVPALAGVTYRHLGLWSKGSRPRDALLALREPGAVVRMRKF